MFAGTDTDQVIPSSKAAPTVEAWLEFIEERERQLHSLDLIEVGQEHQVEFNAVYGICAQAIRYGGAYVVLHRAGRSREAVAVARQALEHALTAQWAHFDETGPDQLIESYHYSRERMFRTMTQYLGTPQADVDAALEATTSSGTRLPRVTNMITQIDFEGMFETEYMRQSQIVHVTSETVNAFLDVGSDQKLTILSEAIDPNERQTARFTAMAAMFAAWLIESLRIDSPGLAELNRLSDELLLPLNIRD